MDLLTLAGNKINIVSNSLFIFRDMARRLL